jgi:hypothetical protein
MSEVVAIQEIAEAAGITKRGAELRAKREAWPFSEEPVRGGRRRLYPLDALPEDVQSAIRRHRAIDAINEKARADDAAHQAERLEQLQREGEAFGAAVRAEAEADNEARRQAKQDGMKRFAALATDDPKRLRAQARRWLVEATWDFRRRHGGDQMSARARFAEGVNAGDIDVPAHVQAWLPRRHGRRSLTEATLRRWHYAYREGGLWALTDGYGSRKGHSKIESTPELYKLVLGCMLQHPHIQAKKIKAYVAATRPELDIASVRAIQRFMKSWTEENAQLWTYLTNPDRWKNVFMAAVGSQTERVERLNQVWELDSTPGDWMLTDGRHSVVGVIDLYSRRLKLYVSKTSTASAVCQVFRRAALDWGLCEAARTDNGKDYVAEQFETVLRDLEVEHEICLPFASEQKGTIERAFRTMSHGILDLLPGFIGHSVAERKVIEARKSFADRVMTKGEAVEVGISSGELQVLLDKWTEVYHHNAHSGLEDRTPFEVATSWRAPVRRIRDERALDALLAEVAGTRTIEKKGIRLDNHRFDSPALFEHVGRTAVIKRDEQDIGRVYVYVDGEFITVAECPELLGISRKERAAAAKHAQKRFLAAQAQQYKGFRKEVDSNIAQVVLEHQIETSRKVEALHRPSLDYTTEGLREAGRAARAFDAPEAQPPSEAERSVQEEIARDLAAPRVESLPQTARQRFQRWVRLQRRRAEGEALTPEEQHLITSYGQHAECASEHEMHVEFGLLVDGKPVEFKPVAQKKNARVERA